MSEVFPENNSKVLFVRSLEEIEQIISCHGEKSLKSILMYFYVSFIIFGANIFLSVAKFLSFKKIGYIQQKFRRIVVYTVGILGDTVSIMPAMAALRSSYPEAHITVVSNCQLWSSQAASELLGNSSFADNLIIVKELDCPVQRHGWTFSLDVPELKNLSCDLFVNLSPFGNRGWFGVVVREMILAKMVGAQYAVGFRMNSYNHRGKFDKVYHMFINNEPRRYKDIINQLGLQTIENVDFLPHNTESRQKVLKKLSEKGNVKDIFFVINPGAKFKAQCWPAKQFGEIAKKLAEKYNATIVITGNSDEGTLANDVVKASGGIAINMAGETTIQDLVELIRGAKGCITNDTGTMHIAAMAGVPTVAIFTIRQNPVHWFPIGQNVIALFGMLDCKFCYDDMCDKNDCLLMIETRHVVNAMEKLFDDKKVLQRNVC